MIPVPPPQPTYAFPAGAPQVPLATPPTILVSATPETTPAPGPVADGAAPPPVVEPISATPAAPPAPAEAATTPQPVAPPPAVEATSGSLTPASSPLLAVPPPVARPADGSLLPAPPGMMSLLPAGPGTPPPPPPQGGFDRLAPAPRPAQDFTKMTDLEREAAFLIVITRCLISYPVATTAIRKRIFDAHMQGALEVLEEKEKREAEAARAGFEALLNEVPLRHNMTYDQFLSLYGDDPRFGALPERARVKAFDERVFPLKQEEKRRREREADEHREALAQDLRAGIPGLKGRSSRAEVDMLLGSNPHYAALQPADREDVVKAQQRIILEEELEAERHEERKRREERRRREEEEYQKECEDRLAGTPRTIHTNECDDAPADLASSVRHCGLRAREVRDQARAAFTACLRDLVMVPGDAEEKFRKVLQNKRYDIGMHLPWAEARGLVELEEGFDEVPLDADRERIYDRWVTDMLREAKLEMRRALRDNDEIQDRGHKLSLEEAKAILKHEKPYKRLKHRKAERDAIIGDYLRDLRDSHSRRR
ncbi:hypothetical protein PAPYR_6198 [Paratrimastix pyriformis]|uniref:FF domain-containing protein n=1 Tax=Paratrimastix pyriformis TaxID=342808 RepID=A0ABQ8UIQ2_9EUKA|nr:hypothetical protein PAPYR_6198 [Paratrimastix pyriformis]